MHIELRRAVTNPFIDHPEFQLIWPAVSSCVAQEATAEALENKEKGLFVILADGAPAGITGYFELESADQAWWGLRWHGVVASHRGKGVSAKALSLVAGALQDNHPAARMLVEYIPHTGYSSYLFRHFEALGFSALAQPEHVDWISHPLQAYGVSLDKLLCQLGNQK